MLKLVKKSAFISLGLAAMSATAVRRYANKIAKEGNLSEEEGKKLVDDLLKQSKKSKADLKQNINNSVKESVVELDLATKSDIQKVNTRLTKIENSIKPKAKPKAKANPKKK